MPAPFAALEQRTALAVRDRLANAVAVCTPAGGGVSAEVSVVFDAAYVDALGVQSVGPVLQGVESDLEPYVRNGAVFNVRGVSYKNVGAETDGTGMTAIRLQRLGK